MKSTEGLLFALRAGYAFFYVQSWEINSHVEAMMEAVEQFEFDGAKPFFTASWDFEEEPDPEGVIPTLDKLEGNTVMFAKNLHWFLQDFSGDLNKQLVQSIQNRAERYTTQESRRSLVIVGAEPFSSAIPDALIRDFQEITFTLPDQEEIKAMANDVIEKASKNPKFKKPNEEDLNLIIDNSRGMSKREIKNAFAYSIVANEGIFDAVTVGDIQAKEISKTPGCSIGKFDTPEPQGMEQVKKFASYTFLNPKARELAKGILLLGPAGTGKTMFAQWVASTCKMKCVVTELAAVFGSLVGETEKNMRRILDVVAANAPCVWFIDEIDKGLAGMGKQSTGGSGDGGVTERAMGQFLKFLSDERPPGVLVIATCNNIQKLPPEWVRVERWDCAPFYIGLPDDNTKQAILDYYRDFYQVEGEPSDMEGWSGAEIKSVCRIAKMMDRTIEEAERFIIPVSQTMEEDITSLEKWAQKRCIPANIEVNDIKSKKKSSRQIDF
jgi:SpoVK/Ycf46/Vps4 family AAA+-type ATPase